jgi:hypothetical protein
MLHQIRVPEFAERWRKVTYDAASQYVIVSGHDHIVRYAVADLRDVVVSFASNSQQTAEARYLLDEIAAINASLRPSFETKPRSTLLLLT